MVIYKEFFECQLFVSQWQPVHTIFFSLMLWCFGNERPVRQTIKYSFPNCWLFIKCFHLFQNHNIANYWEMELLLKPEEVFLFSPVKTHITQYQKFPSRLHCLPTHIFLSFNVSWSFMLLNALKKKLYKMKKENRKFISYLGRKRNINVIII